MKKVATMFFVMLLGGSCNSVQNTRLSMREAKDWELIEAAKRGDQDRLLKLVDEGADIETRDYEVDDDTEYTPLHHACEQGHLEAVRALIARGAKIDARTTNKGRTPAHYACMAGHTAVVRYLRECNADMTATDSDKQGSALHYACRAGHLEVVRELLENIENLAKLPLDADGGTVLHSAAASGSVEVARYLVDALGAEALFVKDSADMTPLHYAAIVGDENMVAYLITACPRPKLSAFLDCKSQQNMTALECASRHHRDSPVVTKLAHTAADTAPQDHEDRVVPTEMPREGPQLHHAFPCLKSKKGGKKRARLRKHDHKTSYKSIRMDQCLH